MTEQEKISVRNEVERITREVSVIACSLRGLAILAYEKADNQNNQEAFNGIELKQLKEITSVLYDTCDLIQSTCYQIGDTTNDMLEDKEETLFL